MTSSGREITPDHQHSHPDAENRSKIRLQRVLADMGLASRRDAERMIEDGRVAVNGKIVSVLPVFVSPSRDEISIDGQTIRVRSTAGKRSSSNHVHLLLNKPDNTLTVSRDSNPEDPRRTVFDLLNLQSIDRRLIVVGRLGYHATGLVLLTSDGELAHRLSHARFDVCKTYRIVVKGRLHDQAIESLTRFCPKAAPIWWPADEPREPLRITRSTDSATTIEIVIRAGAGAGGSSGMRDQDLRLESQEHRSRRVDRGQDAAPQPGDGGVLARMLTRMGNPIRKLERIAIGPVSMRFLEPGEVRKLTKDEVAQLYEAVGMCDDRQTRKRRSGKSRASAMLPPKNQFAGRRNKSSARPIKRNKRSVRRKHDS